MTMIWSSLGLIFWSTPYCIFRKRGSGMPTLLYRYGGLRVFKAILLIFEVLAELSVVWWLEIRGQIDCRFLSPNTNYRVVFALKFTENPSGWEVPIRFSVTTPKGEQMELEKRLNERRGENQGINGGWMEVVAGEFTTRPETDDGDDSHIKFYMKEVLRRIPKRGASSGRRED